MTKMKKLVSLMLAALMLLSMMSVAGAADENGATNTTTGSITISDASVGQTYNVYRILDLQSYSGDAYSYTVNDAWKDFFKENSESAKGLNYFTIDSEGYVSWKDDVNKETGAAALAADALAYAETNSISPAAEAITATEGTVTFAELALGYYLVDSTLGALCSLNTTDPVAEIEEKNVEPTITKEVQEDSKANDVNGGWGDKNDADIDQVVNFKATITAQAGAENYVLHDVMSAGLTFINNTDHPVAVTLNSQQVDASNYEVVTSELDEECAAGHGQCDFHVVFTEDFCKTLNTNDTIVITYSAILNNDAVIASTGNPNDAALEYNNDVFTEWDRTTTYTWEMDIFKYTAGTDGAKNALAGATFKLSTDENGNNVIKFTDVTELPEDQAEGSVEKVYEVDSTGNVETITTNDTGKFSIQGLDEGTYYLTETVAPDGYNKLTKPIKIVISSELTGSAPKSNITQDATAVNQVEVLNQSGALLPSTGGIGTTIFYAVGGLLVVLAVVLLVTKRRVSEDG